MSTILAAALLFSVLNNGTVVAAKSRDENFFQICPPSRCSEGGPEIRFPFRLQTSPPSCGAPGMELLCSELADTILVHPNLGLCKVTVIEYRYGIIDVIPLEASKCPLRKIIYTNLSTEVYRPYGPEMATAVSCSTEVRPTNQFIFAGPISCLSNKSEFTYLVSSFASMDVLPLDCVVLSNGIWIPYPFNNESMVGLSETAKRSIAFGEMTFEWSVLNITNVCQDCEIEGRHCGFHSETRQAFCKNHSKFLMARTTKNLSGTTDYGLLFSDLA